MNEQRWALPIIAGGLLIFTALTVWICFVVPTNERLYALLANIVGNFSGSLFTLLKMSGPTITTTSTPPKTEMKVDDR